MLWSGCSLQPLQKHPINDLGYFESRESEPQAAGVVVGVPHAFNEPAAVEYATAFSAKSGAGIVAAYGYGSNNSGGLPQTEINVLDFGKIETIPGKRGQGIVIGAPHGTFDVYTAGIVRTICSRIRLAGVIATGFTPTETEDGRRINVNRPTERYIAASDREFETERAKLTYERFRSAVLSAAQAQLELYVDLHQNGGERIEVATVGVSKEEASYFKRTFYLLRDQALAATAEIAGVDLAIEPLDELDVGAWAAKTNGILTVAKRSLHFELPASVLAYPRQRSVYTSILAELIQVITASR
jgi:hypothetical protein